MRFLFLILFALLLTHCSGKGQHIPREQAYCVRNFNPNPMEIPEKLAEKVQTNDYSFLPAGHYSFVEANLFYKWTAQDRIKTKLSKTTKTTPTDKEVNELILQNKTNDVMIYLVANTAFLENFHKYQKAEKQSKTETTDKPLKKNIKPLLTKNCFRGLRPSLESISHSSQAITSFNISKDSQLSDIKLADFSFKYFDSQFERSFDEVDNTKSLETILANYSDFQLFKLKKLKPTDEQFYEIRTVQTSKDNETVHLSIKYKIKTLKSIEEEEKKKTISQ